MILGNFLIPTHPMLQLTVSKQLRDFLTVMLDAYLVYSLHSLVVANMAVHYTMFAISQGESLVLVL